MKARVQEPESLLEFVLEMLSSASRTTARNMIKQGRILVDGSVVHLPDTPLRPRQTVVINPADKAQARKPTVQAPSFPIVFEDDHIIAVRKPAGLLTIGTDKERTRTLYRKVSDYVKATSQKKIFIVHRLDRDVSGIIVFAKSESAKRKLQDGWHTARKVYHAAVAGHPPAQEGVVNTWLVENKAHRVYVGEENTPGAEQAETHYRVLKRRKEYSVLEVDIKTGRKHQIRVHMAHIGCPIVGDKQYGAPDLEIPGLGRGIALHASRLEVDHPVTGRRLVLKGAAPTWLKAK